MRTKEGRCLAAKEYHAGGMNCAQSVLAAFADRVGLTEEQCLAIGTGFGGGMRCGSVCGALSGAVMALGMLHPSLPEGGPVGKAASVQRTQELVRRFREQFDGEKDCPQLLALKELAGTPMVQQVGAEKHCDKLIVSAVELLYDYLEELKGE